MSKRFGRQQKRAFRQRVAALEKAHDYDIGLLTHNRELLEHQSRALKTVARVLGENFIGLPVVKRNIEARGPVHRMPLTAQLDIMPTRDLAGLVSYAVLNLEAHELTVERDRLRGLVHAELRIGNRQSYRYHITEEGLRQMPRECLTEIYARHIAEDFAHAIGEL